MFVNNVNVVNVFVNVAPAVSLSACYVQGLLACGDVVVGLGNSQRRGL